MGGNSGGLDMHSNVGVVQSIDPAAISTDTNTDGTGYNRRNDDQVGFMFSSGAQTDGVYQMVPQHSDDGTTWVDVPTADIIPAGVDLSDLGADSVVFVGYAGSKAHVRPRITSTSTTTGAAAVGAYILTGRAAHAPGNDFTVAGASTI